MGQPIDAEDTKSNESDGGEKRSEQKGFTGKILLSCLFIILITGVTLTFFAVKYYRTLTEKPFWETDTKTWFWDNTEFVKGLENLELSERVTNETIEKKETRIFNIPWWGPIGPSSAEYTVKFKAHYVYYVSAEKKQWKFRYDNGIVYVHAPKLDCRVSIDTGTIEGKYKSGWLVPDEDQKLRKLEKSISSYAKRKSLSRNYVNMVREISRKRIEEFIYEWFLKDNCPVTDIRVKFADEKDFGYLDPSRGDNKRKL